MAVYNISFQRIPNGFMTYALLVYLTNELVQHIDYKEFIKTIDTRKKLNWVSSFHRIDHSSLLHGKMMNL